MTTTTSAKKANQTKTDVSSATDGRGSHSRRLFSSLRTGVPAVLEMALIRVLSAIGVVVFLTITVFGFIPELGAYMNKQAAGALGTSASLPAVIGIWAVPFIFVVAMVFVLELWIIRRFWALGTRRVEKIKRSRLGESVSPVVDSRPVGSKKRKK